jgi:hypothetical protein
MSTQERIEALAQTIAGIAEKQGRTYEETLADMEKIALVQRFRNFVVRNQAEAEAKGYKPSDVQSWVEEDRRDRRGR